MNITDFLDQFNSKTKVRSLVHGTFHSLAKLLKGKEIEELAWQTEFYQRVTGKIKAKDFLISLLVSCNNNASLSRISETLACVGCRSPITPQALMKRINSEKTALFLQKVCAKTLSQKLLSLPQIPACLLSAFNKVLLQDSTSITLHDQLSSYFKGSGGRASSSSAKLSLVYDYLAKDYVSIVLTDQGQSDSRLACQIEDLLVENTLVIRDLGYFRVDQLKIIEEKKAFFLSRFKANVQVYLRKEDEHPINLPKYLDKQCQEGILDCQVYITDQKFPVRLVAGRAPTEIADKRRREAKATAKKQGRTIRDLTLNLCDFTIFITNVPSSIWRSDVIQVVYRVRWHIELIFKCWKSRAEIAYLNGKNFYRIKCFIFLKLIYILLVHNLYKLAELIACHRGGISLSQIFAWVEVDGRLLKLVRDRLTNQEKRIFLQAASTTFCQQHRTRRTTFQLLCEPHYQASFVG